MFILHVKHFSFNKFLKFTPCKKRCRVSILLRLFPANYKIFEVPVSVFARASGNAVSAVRPWDRGWNKPGKGLLATSFPVSHLCSAACYGAGIYMGTGAKLSPFNKGVSARIALQKPMMPCSNFFWPLFFPKMLASGGKVEKNFSGHSKKGSKNFFRTNSC